MTTENLWDAAKAVLPGSVTIVKCGIGTKIEIDPS